MNNLRQTKGSLKGQVGEIIFAFSKKYIHLTKMDSTSYLSKLPLKIPPTILKFLAKHWHSIDAFEFITEQEIVTNVIIYEIKTMNHYASKGINFGSKPRVTKNIITVLQEAKSLNFEIKSVWIIFYDNWNYSIRIADFLTSEYLIWSGNPLYSK